jgi:hypothetical protein
MKSMFTNWLGNRVQIDRRYAQLIVLLVTLLLFVLGGGAPMDSFACGGC